MSEKNPEDYDPQQSYAARQLSRYDMQVAGIVVYVVTMTMLFVVALVMMLFRNEPVTQAHAQVAKPSTAVVRVSPANESGRAENAHLQVHAQR